MVGVGVVLSESEGGHFFPKKLGCGASSGTTGRMSLMDETPRRPASMEKKIGKMKLRKTAACDGNMAPDLQDRLPKKVNPV